jgi:LysM repeat protein
MLIHWIIVLFILLLTFVFTSVTFASPFDSFERELKDYIKSDTYQYHNEGEDTKIDKLFSQDADIVQESSGEAYSKVASNIRLPSSIPINRVLSTEIVRPKKKIVRYYTVKHKDTLSAIAKKYKTSVVTLKKHNHLRSNLIRVGHTLTIPGGTKSVDGRRIVKYKVFTKPVVNGAFTSAFGYRRDPFNSSQRNYHSGIDISAAVGTPVIAASDGVVVFTGRNGGYGNTVKIRHSGGYDTHYAHCSTTTVKTGQKVKMGDVIGSVGRTGTATGAHLHFEVLYRGKYVNPRAALNKVRVVVTKLSASNG